MPKFHETFLSILDVLSHGDIMEYKEMRERILAKFYSDLPNEILSQRTKSGGLLILNRIGWGKSYLKEAKFIHQPQRAMVQITDKGKKLLEKGSLSLAELQNDPDYVECQNSKERNIPRPKKDEALTSSSPQDLIDHGFTIIENDVKNDLLEKFKQLNPYYFEKVILMLLKKMGYGDFVALLHERGD